MSPDERAEMESAFADEVRRKIAFLKHSPGEHIIRFELEGAYPDTILHVQVAGAPGGGDRAPQHIELWRHPILGPLPTIENALLVAVWATGG